ncbi:hypothetical protein BDQ12DRAFT_671003 [Crucibulum laeve]|uniref:Uncharacterized protein n=1 Tax=Crucibulum laeve TaxID=68775 RepID=A0A5C3LHB9_9AGAR|nr:hypothetical protein BDQ12DRAFT_671003 [Crucibulum laeve]
MFQAVWFLTFITIDNTLKTQDLANNLKKMKAKTALAKLTVIHAMRSNTSAAADSCKCTMSAADTTAQPSVKKGKTVKAAIDGEADGNRNEKQKEELKGQKGKNAPRKTLAEKVAAVELEPTPSKLTKTETVLVDEGTTVAPPRHSCTAVTSLLPAAGNSGVETVIHQC